MVATMSPQIQVKNNYWILMIHIMMDINEHQDQRYTRGDNNGRDLYLLGVNVLVLRYKKTLPNRVGMNGN